MSRSDAHDETLEASPRSTIEPARATVDDAGQHAIAQLARIQRGALTIEGPLGEGGMGLVQLATQSALGRKVAVKTLKPAQRGPANTMQLLREAWITGSLEHPNVVPVYDVSLDGDGAPVVVLRRIEGTEWSALMCEPELVAKRFGARDLLEWNLRVLIQLCNAIHFAHQRGILHRDLKPDNVMLGELGEVYVLDWGIAIALEDDGTGRLPLRANARQLAGTPAYMAPEMWSGEPERLSERTDVYLLGALLYEIICGRPPHTGSTLAELCASASAEPLLPATPSALVAICRRALSIDPADRYESALALRHALDDFLAHQEAARLVEGARAGLGRLRAAIAAASTAHAEVYNLFGACRFGFEQALARIDGAEGARAGLVEATTLMVDYELRSGDPRAAQTLLSALSAPPAELVARVDEAARRHAEEQAQRRAFEAVGRDWDVSVGRRTRTFLGLSIGVVWTLLPLWGALSGRWSTDYRPQGIMASVFLVMALAAAIWARDSMLRTQLNRGILGGVILTPLSQVLLYAGGWVGGMNADHVATIAMFSWFMMASTLGVVLDRRLLLPASAYLVGFFLGARWPETRLWSTAVGNALLAITVLWMWLPGLRGGDGPRGPSQSSP